MSSPKILCFKPIFGVGVAVGMCILPWWQLAKINHFDRDTPSKCFNPGTKSSPPSFS
jgi:hypothetical protein